METYDMPSMRSPTKNNLLDAVDAVVVGVLDGAHLLFGNRIKQHDRFFLAGCHQD